MKKIKKILDQLIYSFRNTHQHQEPVPSIYQSHPLIWTPQKKKGKK